MSDFLPAMIALAILGACFVYGYLTDPSRHPAANVQPAHGEAYRPENSHSVKIPHGG